MIKEPFVTSLHSNYSVSLTCKTLVTFKELFFLFQPHEVISPLFVLL